MTELLAAVDVAQMDFDCGQGYAGHRVANGVGVVGERTGIHQQSVGPGPRSVNFVDQRAFGVALKGANYVFVSGSSDQLLVDRFQGYVAVDRPFARAQKIQIGAMEYQDFSHDKSSCCRANFESPHYGERHAAATSG